MFDGLTLLVVETAPADAEEAERLLADAGVPVVRGGPAPDEGVALHRRGRVDAARDWLDQGAAVDAVLFGVDAADGDPLDRLGDVSGETALLALTGDPSLDRASEAVARGAQDCLVADDLAPARFSRALALAVARQRRGTTLDGARRTWRTLDRLARNDVRNDLSLIVGRARELSEHVDRRGADALEDIVRTSNHVLQLTRTAGDVTDLTTSDGAPAAPVDLRQLLETELDRARERYGGAVVTTEGELPAVDVRGDALLPAAVGQLLSDAVRYNDEDEPTATVSVAAADERVVVRVADNGPTVPERRRGRVDAADADLAGVGAGLFLAARIVERQGGTVHVEANDPKGTVVVVELLRAGQLSGE